MDIPFTPLFPVEGTDTINFVDTVTAGSAKTVTSKVISRGFTVFAVRIAFALNTNRLLKVRVIVSPDDSCPTSLPVNGTNLLLNNSPEPYIVGDDEAKYILKCYHQDEGNAFIKVFAENSDGYDHTLDVQVFVVLH